MRHSRANRRAGSPARRAALGLFACGAAAVCPLWGCADHAPAQGPTLGAPTRPARNGASPPSPPNDDRPPAVVNGRDVAWLDLRPALVEAAGAAALEEAALDIALRDALADRGVRFADLDVAAERAILVEQLAQAAPGSGAAPPEAALDRGERLLRELRATRGLGEHRFEGLLRRNAGLRRLVRDEVVINERVIRQAYDLRYGARIPARIIVVETIGDAARAIERLDAGEPFPEVAARLSTDESASRGGLLEPVNPADPSYPQALRDALRNLAPGERSRPVALDAGFAILLRETSDLAPQDAPTLDAARPTLEREARLRQERLLMGERARELLSRSRITVFDDDLNRAWRTRTGANP